MKIQLFVVCYVLSVSNQILGCLPRARALTVVRQSSTNRIRPHTSPPHYAYKNDISPLDFQTLPQALQDAHMQRQYPGSQEDLKEMIDLVQNRKEKHPAEFHMNLPFLVWRMVQNQKVSHKTAAHILDNLNRLSFGKPMINDFGIDWEQEQANKLELVEQVNCPSVEWECKQDIDCGYSIALQEFVYSQHNPFNPLVFDGPVMKPEMVSHAAEQMGCHNLKAFDVKRPGLEHHEECNHKFCCE